MKYSPARQGREVYFRKNEQDIQKHTQCLLGECPKVNIVWSPCAANSGGTGVAGVNNWGQIMKDPG